MICLLFHLGIYQMIYLNIYLFLHSCPSVCVFMILTFLSLSRFSHLHSHFVWTVVRHWLHMCLVSSLSTWDLFHIVVFPKGFRLLELHFWFFILDVANDEYLLPQGFGRCLSFNRALSLPSDMFLLSVAERRRPVIIIHWNHRLYFNDSIFSVFSLFSSFLISLLLRENKIFTPAAPKLVSCPAECILDVCLLCGLVSFRHVCSCGWL